MMTAIIIPEKSRSQLFQLALVSAFCSGVAEPMYSPLIATGSALGVTMLVTTIMIITRKKRAIS